MYEGKWIADKRNGGPQDKCKMRFLDGSVYKGQFIQDQADGIGQVEDSLSNIYLMEASAEKEKGAITNGRL